jgi:signal transduction histidine kinase
MKDKNRQIDQSLEDRLFRYILLLGVLCTGLLIIYDTFYTLDYHSVAIEFLAVVFFATYLVAFRNKNITPLHKYIFSFILFCFINIGWLTGAGINLLNTSLFFLCVAIILILNDHRHYYVIFTIVVLDLIGLFCLQYYTDLWVGKPFSTAKQNLLNDYITASFFIFISSYLIVFLKLNYNKERARLNQLNTLLEDKSSEISYQNEELKMSKEVLDSIVVRLEDQATELMTVKGSLEEKVNARTNDLLKLNERLIGQNQQLEQYAYITSHNLRAPIAQIKGLISVLPDEKGFTDLTRETLKKIHESAENLEKVFADLSQIIKIEKSMQQPWQDVELNLEIQAVLKSLKTSIVEKDIKVTASAQQSTIVKALSPYVYSVLHNIIENAVKYSDAGKKESYIKIEIDETNKYYRVSITDNGIGIDMEMASGKVFQMYQRFNNTHPGQGFGLFLVKSQMEAMQGQVEVESILGQGTTFNLYFPKR